MSELNTFPVPAVGGLDLVSPPQVLAQKAGAAVQLNNYEAVAEGGYRRINGYESFGDIPDGFNTLQVRGMAIYKGVVVVVGQYVLHSPDGVTFFPVNLGGCLDKPSLELNGLAELPRHGAGKVEFAKVNIDGHEQLIITDSMDSPCILKVVGDLYTYKEVVGDTTKGMVHATRYQDHVVIGGSKEAPGLVAVSARFKPDDFSGTGSWSVTVQDEVTGLHTFRDYLYIFCRSSIYRVVNLESSANVTVRPVTTKIGCVDGSTIQEIGGDIIFLAADGLRYLGATERIDDVSLTVVSRPIKPLTDKIDPSKGPISSVVIPSKAQYRLYYTNTGGASVGIIGTLVQDNQFHWSTISDMNVIDIASEVDEGDEKIYHVGAPRIGALRVYRHDIGDTFDGTPFVSTWKTPVFHMGDSAVRKRLHSMMGYLEATKKADIKMIVKFDYERPTTLQPEPFYFVQHNGAMIYGETRYGEGVFGSLIYPTDSIFLEGSGKWIQFIFMDNAVDNASYIMRGFDLQFSSGGRI
ncbi:hypothetical protein MQM1_011 [Aeromonas phage vB_AsaP_MQM1]|nr:hypothetical protein MQM1_011 [Aeromonas phage vB_AsaP_MQM1]